MSKFIHRDLRLIEPNYESILTDLIIELEKLRIGTLTGTTHPAVFFQLKSIFQMLESIGSARIEGNNTTISEFIETQIENRPYVNERIQEIRNIEKALLFIEEQAEDLRIDRSLISEIHKVVVEGLTPPPVGEGDLNPGLYRKHTVEIKGAEHRPPESQQQVDGYMQDLFAFLNAPSAPKYDLLKICLAHHRLMWIHPFGNGNGRVGRVFTYALLVRAGYNVHIGQILNPTAVFCIDREEYYRQLSIADRGSADDLANWCIYVLSGLQFEINKVERLSNYAYLTERILLPALAHAKKMKYIDATEHAILKVAAEKQIIQNSDIQETLKGKHMTSISRYIRALREKKMLATEEQNTRKYHLNFTSNFLLRSVIYQLESEGFIPISDAPN